MKSEVVAGRNLIVTNVEKAAQCPLIILHLASLTLCHLSTKKL